MCGTRPVFSLAPSGRLIHSPLESLGRHCHRTGYTAVVLKGAYLEAGDTGRISVGPGDVLVHGPFEAHLNRVSHRGAEVLLLPPIGRVSVAGRLADLDRVVRTAERSRVEAAHLAAEMLTLGEPPSADWPDALASDLRADPSLSLTAWAEAHGLRPETISRGFRLAYGCTPSSFRATARARAAWRDVVDTTQPLAAIAYARRFADQAHMTRAIVRLTGRPAGAWRRGAREHLAA